MDIISPSVTKKVINNSVALLAADNDLAVIPPIQTGYLKRLGLYNPTGGAAVITVEDAYTQDISETVPAPTPVVANRYVIPVPAGDWIDLDGHTISKHMGLLRVNSDTATVVASYVLELE